jgi:hypothetical protein
MRLDPAAFSSPPPTWQKIFGNTNPRVEVGFGKGAFYWRWRNPERNFLASSSRSTGRFRLSSLLNVMVRQHQPGTPISQSGETMIWPLGPAYHLYFPTLVETPCAPTTLSP